MAPIITYLFWDVVIGLVMVVAINPELKRRLVHM
jgi:hypothetical protein